MNVGLDPGACLLIISEPEPRPHKHSASRLRRRTTCISGHTGLLIALFSPFRRATGGEQSRAGRPAVRRRRRRWEKSLLMILHFNYFCKYTRPGLLGRPVSRFFISRVLVRCPGPASRRSRADFHRRPCGNNASPPSPRSAPPPLPPRRTASSFHLVNGHSTTNVVGEST